MDEGASRLSPQRILCTYWMNTSNPTPHSTDSELFDVVDEQDNVIGQLTRAQVHRQRLFHRSVHVLVFNRQKQIFLQRRSRFKDTCPLLWTTSCSGHVDSGETYDQAVVRELVEELGIELPKDSLPQLLFKHPPCRETGHEFIQVYRLEWNQPMHLDADEIEEGRWLTPSELDAWIRSEPAVHSPSLKLVWRLFRGPTSLEESP